MDPGSISDWETKILQAMRHSKNKKQFLSHFKIRLLKNLTYTLKSGHISMQFLKKIIFQNPGEHVYVWLGPFTVHLKLPQHC